MTSWVAASGHHLTFNAASGPRTRTKLVRAVDYSPPSGGSGANPKTTPCGTGRRNARSSSANAPLPIHVEMASLHTNRGAKRAREARTAFGLDPAAPLSCLLTVVEERAGVPLILRAMPEDVAGCLWQR